jgi:hypothetical protein
VSAFVTEAHRRAAAASLWPSLPTEYLDGELTRSAVVQLDRVAQAIADAEARGAVQAIAAHLRAAAARYTADRATAEHRNDTASAALARHRADVCQEAARIVETTGR